MSPGGAQAQGVGGGSARTGGTGRARLLVVNNVPTPYRTYLFNRLWETGLEVGIDLEVVYQAQRVAVHSRWEPEPVGHLCPYRYARVPGWGGRQVPAFFSPWTLSLDPVRAARSGRYRYLLYSPFMSLSGALVGLVPSPGVRRVFWSESNLQSTRHRNGPLGWLKARLAAGSDAVAVPGGRALEYLETVAPGLRGRPVLRLPNLVDPERIEANVAALRRAVPGPREVLGLPPEGIVILSIGRMEDRKGFAAAIDACLAAPEDFTYCILGGGERLEDYRRRVAAAGAGRRILLPGAVDESRVLLYQAAADWLWHPALADPSPLVCVEALFAGLPLAVSRQTGNAPETVPRGRNGLVFDAATPDGVAGALGTMRGTPPAARAAMGAESRRVAVAAFDPARVCRDFLAGLAAL